MSIEIIDQKRHEKVPYLAKDFDAQEGYCFTLGVEGDKTIETGVYLHWLGSNPKDVAIDISCMSGCTRKCKFCAAATMRPSHLTAEQMLAQVAVAMKGVRAHQQDFFDRVKANGKVTFSFQGIGEPADSPAVVGAIALLREHYHDWSEIQFSVSSILENVEALDTWQGLGLQTLQFSLHFPDDERRAELLGANRTKPVADILAHLDVFKMKSPDTEIKVNYLLIAGKNDSDDDADALLGLLASRPEFYLKLSYLNETSPALESGLKASQRHAHFLKKCLKSHSRTYEYGAFQPVHMSCGQLASYATREQQDKELQESVRSLYEEIVSGSCSLFLGAGASYTAWNANELAQELYADLGWKVGRGTSLSLTEVADIYEELGKRPEVDQRISTTLSRASLPGAMLELPRFPWKSIYTTNYDDFVERAYVMANEQRTAARSCYRVMHATELQGIPAGAVPLFKLHGSTSGGQQPILSDRDYLRGYSRSVQMLLRKLELDRLEGSILFIGYSFKDHAIKQQLFDLNRDMPNARRLWAVQEPNDSAFGVDRAIAKDKYGVTLLKTDFAGLMEELSRLRRRTVVLASGSIKKAVGDVNRGAAATGNVDLLCTALAPKFELHNIRLITGATATDKVGFILGSKMRPDLVKTYTWIGYENKADNEPERMINAKPVGNRPAAVIDRLLREATVLLVIGGGALTLREAFSALSLGIPVIPVAVGGNYASDVLHSLFSDHYSAVKLLSHDRGLDASIARSVVSALSDARLERLNIEDHEPDSVAEEIMAAIQSIALHRSTVVLERACGS